MRQSVLDIHKHYEKFLEVQDLDGVTRDYLKSIFSSYSSKKRPEKAGFRATMSEESEDEIHSPSLEIIRKKKTTQATKEVDEVPEAALRLIKQKLNKVIDKSYA